MQAGERRRVTTAVSEETIGAVAAKEQQEKGALKAVSAHAC